MAGMTPPRRSFDFDRGIHFTSLVTIPLTSGMPIQENLRSTQATTSTFRDIDVLYGSWLLGSSPYDQTIDTPYIIRINIFCPLQEDTALKQVTLVAE